MEPTDKATQRTRNRLLEHRMLTAVRTDPNASALGNRPATLFQCVDEGCKWVGWLADEEFI